MSNKSKLNNISTKELILEVLRMMEQCDRPASEIAMKLELTRMKCLLCSPRNW